MLLTLDLATRIGFTLGPVNDRSFKFGTHQLPHTGMELGRSAVAFEVWLTEILERGVTDVVFESPVMPRIANVITLRKLYGLAYHTELVCALRKVTVREANVSAVRKFIAGSGRAKKHDVVAAVRLYGFDARDHDEADAIAIRLYTIANDFPGLSRNFGLELGMLGTNRRA
jgi:Holliday junction resolvasome RuvABC endonuclease subunit